MTRFKLILNSFLHYFKGNLFVALGVGIAAAVLTGALVIGDSVTYSLEQSTFYRLGNTTHLITSTDRYFRTQWARDIEKEGNIKAVPILILEGMAVSDGGDNRVNKIQINGVDDKFKAIAGVSSFNSIGSDEVIINENLAERLKLKRGDDFLVRIRKASLIPMNAPFVSDAETSISLRAKVKDIAGREKMGFFNLKNSQTTPYNIFMSLTELNRLMSIKDKANNILISAPYDYSGELEHLLNETFAAEDAGLIVKDIPLTKEKEIVSERVFIENSITDAFHKWDNSYYVLTYFVNEIRYKDKATPYSFVSAIENENLKDSEIIINDWTSIDLGVKRGEVLRLKYYEVGPLRQLTVKEDSFIIKDIVAIEGKYGDRELMPYIPGLSDAENCRDWETGVPIDLEAIRDKDETYWNKFRGVPKAFISMSKAQQIWANRFGNHTAIRISNSLFSENEYREFFSSKIKPADLGIFVTPVKENGLKAARDGVDFSQLFLGLSFFLLMAAVILIGLLFILNLETRKSQIGTLIILGFTRKQILAMLLYEGFLISVLGALFGLGLTILYTDLIFKALNSLWWEIVRTSVLEIKFNPATLITGLIISILVSLLSIYMSVRQNLKKQAVELQRHQERDTKMWIGKTKRIISIFSLIASLVIVCLQLLKGDSVNPVMFFLSGTLLLTGLLLLTDIFFRKSQSQIKTEFNKSGLIRRNSSQNPGRSITIIIIFALATFLVVSTGANRKNLFSKVNEKSSGTGGFLYFAETTVPVLYDLNDRERKEKEGFLNEFSVAQFSKIEGDDASCLNLNRISNPAILGVDPELMDGRFSFAAKDKSIEGEDCWKALNSSSNMNVIPAIADQTVIQWGLGKKTGDTLLYRNESGDTLRLKLIAGLSPSVFQGYVLISKDNFLKNYPSNSGSHVFLVEGAHAEKESIAEELKEIFRDFGWEMTSTGERLMEFNSVTNTYLSIFLALGALGLILGTIGLAVVLARSILERKREIGLMQGLGFSGYDIWNLLTREYLSLLITGLLIGLVSAAVAVWPNIAFQGAELSLGFILFIIAFILLNGIFWIALLSWLFLKSREIMISLRNQS